MPNGRANGSEIKLLKRVTLMLAAAHRDNLRRFAENERRFAENERRMTQNERRISQNEQILAEQKKLTTIHSKAIIKLLSQ